MVTLDLSEVNEPFLDGRVGGGEQVAPDSVHIRPTDPTSFVCDLDHNVLCNKRGEGRRGANRGANSPYRWIAVQILPPRVTNDNKKKMPGGMPKKRAGERRGGEGEECRASRLA